MKEPETWRHRTDRATPVNIIAIHSRTTTPRSYDDPLERALATEPVSAIQAQPFVTIPPQATVEEAMTKLVDLSIACLLVEEDGKLLGVFSERDALNKVALEYEQVKDRPIREFMTSSPIYVFNTDSSAAALSVMAATGYRHVPVGGPESSDRRRCQPPTRHQLSGTLLPAR